VYKVVRSSYFDDALHEITRDPTRAQQFIDGATWVLERDPRVGAENQGIWTIPSIDEAYEIYYEIDDAINTVMLWTIYTTVAGGE
jgi:hypothetical protein